MTHNADKYNDDDDIVVFKSVVIEIVITFDTYND